MACGCGSSNGTPKGWKNNGGCSSGGCNRMNVHDWLLNMPVAGADACTLVEVSFNNGSRKDFYRNAALNYFEKGQLVTVEGVSGFDVGEVSLSGELVKLQMKKRGIPLDSQDIRRVLRRAGQFDLDKMKESKAREKETLIRSRAIARQLKLNMKLAEVEIQADGKKATFFYIADDRVDFRELIKIYASEFKLKVEMRQIGPRQEAGKVGGIGSCGRELCCSTWLTSFKSVNTTAARYQNLSINQAKLSGQCGRLKCCLNYELDTYMDALRHFPNNADALKTKRGNALLIKKDIFRNLMWYSLPDSSRYIPLTLQRVQEILALNANGEYVEELQPAEVEVRGAERNSDKGMADGVGGLTLKGLEKTSRKIRSKQKDQRQERPGRQEGNTRSEGAPHPNRQKQNKPKQGGQQNQGNRPQRTQGPKNQGGNPENTPRKNSRNRGHNPNRNRNQGEGPKE